MSLCDTRKAMKMGATNVEKRSLKTKHLAPIFRAETEKLTLRHQAEGLPPWTPGGGRRGAGAFPRGRRRSVNHGHERGGRGPERNRRPHLLHVLRQRPQVQPGIPGEYPQLETRERARARRMEPADHGRQPRAHSRAGPSPGGVWLLAAFAALRGRKR